MLVDAWKPAGLSGLARLSAHIGRNANLVHGAGGNTSLKRGEHLWVKASGAWLAEAHDRPIFVPVRFGGVRLRLAANDADPVSAEVDACWPFAQRPSIEAVMHAVLPHPVVVHVHSVNAIASAARVDGQHAFEHKLQGLDWTWIPYARPGLPLVRAIQAAAPTPPDILVLANHGLVVCGATIEAAGLLLDEVERRLALTLRQGPPPDRGMLGSVAGAINYRICAFEEGHWPATDPKSLAIVSGGALYPDHVVFLGPSPMTVLPADSVPSHLAAIRLRKASDPAAILIPGAGTLVRADLGPSADEMLRCLGLVAARLDPADQLVFLTRGQEEDLLNWDAEKYRRALDATRS